MSFTVILVLSSSIVAVSYMQLRLEVVFVIVNSFSSFVSLGYVIIVRLGIVLYMA